MRSEIYVTAAALAAALAATGHRLGIADAIVWPLAALAGFALRGAAIHWSLSIPEYGARSREDGRIH
jgi:uncharacterized membrane protein YeiH